MQYSNIKIYAERSLSYDDHYVLALLYLPLLEDHAYSLYLKMFYLLNSNLAYEDSYASFLDLTTNNSDLFIESRRVLESAGLVTTYVKKTDLLIKLNAPLEANLILNDNVIGYFLRSKYSDEEYSKIAERFTVKSATSYALVNDYKNISQKFNDTFAVINDFDFTRSIYRNKKNSSLVKFNSQFDFNLFYSDCCNLSEYHLVDESFKDFVVELAYVYSLNETEMARAFNRIKDYSKEDFANSAKFVYQNKFNTNKVHFVPQKESTPSKNINYDVSFAKFLTNLTGVPPAAKELNTCLNIYDKFKGKITVGVINVLIEYSLQQQNGRLPNFSYLDTILQSWLRMGVKNVVDAKKAIEVFKQGFYVNKKQKKVTIPYWVSHPDKDVDNEPLDMDIDF